MYNGELVIQMLTERTYLGSNHAMTVLEILMREHELNHRFHCIMTYMHDSVIHGAANGGDAYDLELSRRVATATCLAFPENAQEFMIGMLDELSQCQSSACIFKHGLVFSLFEAPCLLRKHCGDCEVNKVMRFEESMSDFLYRLLFEITPLVNLTLDDGRQGKLSNLVAEFFKRTQSTEHGLDVLMAKFLGRVTKETAFFVGDDKPNPLSPFSARLLKDICFKCFSRYSLRQMVGATTFQHL